MIDALNANTGNSAVIVDVSSALTVTLVAALTSVESSMNALVAVPIVLYAVAPPPAVLNVDVAAIAAAIALAVMVAVSLALREMLPVVASTLVSASSIHASTTLFTSLNAVATAMDTA